MLPSVLDFFYVYRFLPSPSMAAIFLFLLSTYSVPPSQSLDDGNFTACKTPVLCGPQNLSYPFWGVDRPRHCGRDALHLYCEQDEEDEYLALNISDTMFRVGGFNESDYSMKVSRTDFHHGCPQGFINTTFNLTLFRVVADRSQITSIFYGCPLDISTKFVDNYNCDSNRDNNNNGCPLDISTKFQGNYSCNFDGNNGHYDLLYINSLEFSRLPNNTQQTIVSLCTGRIEVLVNNEAYDEFILGSTALQQAIDSGFLVQYITEDVSSCSACSKSGGSCGTNSTSDQFACYRLHPSSMEMALWVKIVIVLATIVTLVVLLSSAICCYDWRPWNHSSLLNGNSHRSIEAFIREYQALASKRYNYSDITKMTNSFKDKLGQGGYSSVYKGKLPDGRLVAVKVLNSSKGNGEEFINEVASISRTSHVNVVALLGFCFEGSKRALIYEFMLNGSLEKFIRNDNSLISDHPLGVELLHKIAIGIAQGLGYLHRGCSTRILHFDIKPHNILLDEDFIPKISDFGLAKLCHPKESRVSMADARGTIGYIAPEVFSRNFGGVSHKSDVYSYGMVILEMVGGKRNTNAGLSHSSDVYFPDWVYKRLELGEDIAFHSSMTIEENERVKRMVLVGLWCIQTDPSLRPSMSKVLEMLEGTVETLLLPPKPFLSSAASLSPTISFTTSDVEIQL